MVKANNQCRTLLVVPKENMLTSLRLCIHCVSAYIA